MHNLVFEVSCYECLILLSFRLFVSADRRRLPSAMISNLHDSVLLVFSNFQRFSISVVSLSGRKSANTALSQHPFCELYVSRRLLLQFHDYVQIQAALVCYTGLPIRYLIIQTQLQLRSLYRPLSDFEPTYEVHSQALLHIMFNMNKILLYLYFNNYVPKFFRKT